jgi:hypothetical protein
MSASPRRNARKRIVPATRRRALWKSMTAREKATMKLIAKGAINTGK